MSEVQSVTGTQELLDGFGKSVMDDTARCINDAIGSKFIKVFISAPKQKKKKEKIKVTLWRSPLKFLFCVSYVVKTAADSIKGKGSLCPCPCGV